HFPQRCWKSIRFSIALSHGGSKAPNLSICKQQVKFSVFLQYLRATGWGYTVIGFLVYLLQNIAFIGQSLWLSDWTNDVAVDYYDITLLLAEASISASRILHSRLLNNILRVPTVFYDAHWKSRQPLCKGSMAIPQEFIIKTFPQSFRSWLMCVLGVLGTLFVICLATPFFTIIILIIIALALVYFVERFYVASSRQLRRLDSVSRSPIYSHFSETVSGDPDP
ncbi:hypothetical protein KUCAC02_029546, partial [Chaenocephalus aceratus]